jgi:hypothetical protein
MPLQIESTHLNGDVVVVVPQVFGDERGFFMESYRADNFRDFGLPTNFVQENHSRSAKGVLRGLHFQWDPPMGKLVRVSQAAHSMSSRHPQRFAHAGKMVWPGGQRRKQERNLGTLRLRPWILRPHRRL